MNMDTKMTSILGCVWIWLLRIWDKIHKIEHFFVFKFFFFYHFECFYDYYNWYIFKNIFQKKRKLALTLFSEFYTLMIRVLSHMYLTSESLERIIIWWIKENTSNDDTWMTKEQSKNQPTLPVSGCLGGLLLAILTFCILAFGLFKLWSKCIIKFLERLEEMC